MTDLYFGDLCLNRKFAKIMSPPNKCVLQYFRVTAMTLSKMHLTDHALQFVVLTNSERVQLSFYSPAFIATADVGLPVQRASLTDF